ncbi:MAG TPA: flavin reductase family protein [Kaistia sp.]|nr:flavin reductase family protein [Kaistia sp.]
MNTIEPANFWRAVGFRAIGAAVVAARNADGPAGLLALSTAHLSQSPPTMTCAVGLTTSALSTILEAGHFAISFLSEDQGDVAERFGGRTALKGAERFEPARWDVLKTGAPVLKDAVGALDCELDEAIQRHGTMILIGRIVAFHSAGGLTPLVYFQGAPLRVAPRHDGHE